MMMFGVLFLTFLSLSQVMADSIVVQVKQEVSGGGFGGSGCGTNCGDSSKEEEEETVVTTPPNYAACDDDEDGQYLAYTDSEVDYVYLTAWDLPIPGRAKCEEIGMTMITSRPDVYGIIEQNLVDCDFGPPEVWVDLTEDISLITNWVGTSLEDFAEVPYPNRTAGYYGVYIMNNNPIGFLMEIDYEHTSHILCYTNKN